MSHKEHRGHAFPVADAGRGIEEGMRLDVYAAIKAMGALLTRQGALASPAEIAARADEYSSAILCRYNCTPHGRVDPGD